VTMYVQTGEDVALYGKMVGLDFDYNDSGASVAIIEYPKGAKVGNMGDVAIVKREFFDELIKSQQQGN